MRQRLRKFSIGYGVILFVLMLRSLGLSEPFEFLAFDKFLAYLRRLQPEPTSSRITLVSLDEAFLKGLAQKTSSPLSKGSISEASLSELLKRLLQHDPAVLGLDIASTRILPTDERTLAQIVNQNPSVLTVEKALEPKISSLTNLSTSAFENQVVVNDFFVDWDGKVRRAILGVENGDRLFHKSLSFGLAEIYLRQQHQIGTSNGQRDPETVKIGDVEIPRLLSNTGSYRREKTIYGLQMLMNYRRSQEAFPILLAGDILSGQIQPELIRDRILIIGITDPSLAAYSITPVEISQFLEVRSQAVGIELQAHATSQILDAVLDGRPLLKSSPSLLEYVWIFAIGLLGMEVGRFSNSIARNLLSLACLLLLLFVLSLWAMSVWGWWLPIAPSFLVLSLNGIAYIAYYQSERTWKRLVEERDRIINERDRALGERDRALVDLKSERRTTIETAIHAIHNGPLQTLALLMRRSQAPDLDTAILQAELKILDQEIRSLGADLTQAAMTDHISLSLGNGQMLNAALPLHEILYTVFDVTLGRDFPAFEALQVCITDFEPYPGNLSPELKRDIGYFLQEALCNVGKHAIDVTKLTVVGQVLGQNYCLSIKDNGAAADHLLLHQGTGTQQSQALAAQLQGQFSRQPSASSQGVHCKLLWPLR
ncbi:MAG: CHASE2 domain-containing protein [Synechococcales cyanobacterium RM1_1_8]|nr:CHASE2 domain-containing protein [Synechococcales cyanobacterium RM1_1_8]